MLEIKRIATAVAVDSESSHTAKYAIGLARLLNAELVIIYVVNRYLLEELVKTNILVSMEAESYETELEEEGRHFIERFRHMAEKNNIKCSTILLKGVVHRKIAEVIKEEQIDLLVTGDMKACSSRRDVFYDEGERILREAPCPVLVVKKSPHAFFEQGKNT